MRDSNAACLDSNFSEKRIPSLEPLLASQALCRDAYFSGEPIEADFTAVFSGESLDMLYRFELRHLGSLERVDASLDLVAKRVDCLAQLISKLHA